MKHNIESLKSASGGFSATKLLPKSSSSLSGKIVPNLSSKGQESQWKNTQFGSRTSSSSGASSMSSNSTSEVQTLPNGFIVHRGRRIVKKKKRKCVKCKIINNLHSFSCAVTM